MASISLSSEQQAIVQRPLSGETIFVEGPAGAGKTTSAVARLSRMLEAGIPAEQILIIAPQRTLLRPYQRLLRSAQAPPSGQVDTLTVAGLARRMVELFWPLVAERAGFAYPDRPPVFLSLETAQYYMARIIDPMIESGAFEGISIDRNRLISQILDNLNKAALIGIEHKAVEEWLSSAWSGASARVVVYDYAQQAANEFRAYCLAHNLLDFSLQMEVFVNHLLQLPWPPGEGLMSRFTRYRHLIADNIEEDTPITHDLISSWLPDVASALLLYDRDAGYRVFLGADPESALLLRKVCRSQWIFYDSFVTTPDLNRLARELAISMRQTVPPAESEEEKGELKAAIEVSETSLRFHTQVLDWAVLEIAHLIHERQVPPEEIVVLAPYLGDALRFSLSYRLAQLDVPAHSHRPSRALREEPVTRCLLTLATLAHPEWERVPLPADVAQALALAIEPLDRVRSELLTGIVYRPQDNRPVLGRFADLKPSAQARISYQAGNLYDALRDWLYQDQEAETSRTTPLDHLFSRLFSEVLSQPGYGLYQDMDAGRVTAQLVQSARNFRHVVQQANPPAPEEATEAPSSAPPIGLDYVRMVERGVIAAQYIPAWVPPDQEKAVLLAPAYTFLMRNEPVDYQFWLNVGSSGWWERLNQPLTHPYVLTRQWQRGDVWSDAHEVEAQRRTMHRLVQGLIRRCRRRVYLGISNLGEQGYEQRGQLLQAIQGALRRTSIRSAVQPAVPDIDL